MKQIDNKIPDYAARALKELETYGFEAWCVGGCVRDILLNRIPHDWDICTSALPNQTLEVFKNFRTIETGIKHGTVTVIIYGKQVEITTYRTDGDYLDHRRPQQVEFVRDIKSDLMRRDFTMNAVCMNLQGEIYDPFGGEKDIEKGIIRCVGDPKKRFDEDALRILRAVRFAAKTGFEIDPPTAQAAFDMKELLDKISAERIFSELCLLIVSPYAGKILRDYREIIAQIIPEIKPCFDFNQNNPHHCYDVWEHITHSVDLIEPDRQLRLVMLLHDIGKPDMHYIDDEGISHFKGHPLKSAEYADNILKRLKSETRLRQNTIELINEHDNRVPAHKKPVARFISKYGFDFYFDWLKVRRADTLAQSMYRREKKILELDTLFQLGEELKAEQSCITLAQLNVKGGDLMQMGLCGKEIGDMLKRLLAAVINEEVENSRTQLLEFAERILKNE